MSIIEPHMLSIETIRPSMICTIQGFYGTELHKRNEEVVLENIVKLAKRYGDKWMPFTFQDYCDRCRYEVCREEETILERLVHKRCLKKRGNQYEVTNESIRVLAPFIKAEAA